MRKNRPVIIGIIIAIILVVVWLIVGRDDEEQIANEINNHGFVTNIQHIEVLDANKSVAFFNVDDNTEMEMYLEKSLFSWNNKRDNSFNRLRINEPMFISFSNSPFSNEEEVSMVLLRIFDHEINSVQIVKYEEIIHNFELITKGPDEKFGLFRTESDEIYEAEFVAYNSEGEVVYSNTSAQ